jgi:hypothetical protein
VAQQDERFQFTGQPTEELPDWLKERVVATTTQGLQVRLEGGRQETVKGDGSWFVRSPEGEVDVLPDDVAQRQYGGQQAQSQGKQARKGEGKPEE